VPAFAFAGSRLPRLSTASPTVSVPPRAAAGAEPDKVAEELDVPDDPHPARTITVAAASRQPMRFLFMTRSFGGVV
jgi:hypothetical protein